MHRGYIKDWRKSLDHPLFKKPLVWHFWGYCLKKAAYKDTECFINGQVIKIPKGSFVFGRRVAAAETGLTERQIRTALKHLEKLQNLTIETTNRYSIISITKWDIYQQDDQRNDQPNVPRPSQDRPKSDHIQEGQEGQESTELPKGSSSEPEVPTKICPHEKIRLLYNKILPELPTCTVRNKTFDEHTRARWREKPERQNLDWWESLFQDIRKSDFLMGRSKSDFQASLDWIVKPTNMTKILNGNYKNKNNHDKHNNFKEKHYDGTPIDQISWMQN